MNLAEATMWHFRQIGPLFFDSIILSYRKNRRTQEDLNNKEGEFYSRRDGALAHYPRDVKANIHEKDGSNVEAL